MTPAEKRAVGIIRGLFSLMSRRTQEQLFDHLLSMYRMAHVGRWGGGRGGGVLWLTGAKR